MNGRSGMEDHEFDQIRDFVYQAIGVNLTANKKTLVISRLSKRLRQLGYTTFTQYLALVMESVEEQGILFNLITTNVTAFFRESHHLSYLTDVFLAQWMETNAQHKQKTLRIWSAGCSSGEEPYSIAISILDYLVQQGMSGLDFKILATDINQEQLAKAQRGIYKQTEVQGIPRDVLKRHFKLGTGTNAGLFQVKDHIRKQVVFGRVNLLDREEYPIASPLDVIFCRNVFIYFDRETRAKVSDRFNQYLCRYGLLFIGHSESIEDSQIHSWDYIKHTIYRKNS